MVPHFLHETMVSPMSHGSKAIVPNVNPNLIKEQTLGNLINRKGHNFVFGEGRGGGIKPPKDSFNFNFKKFTDILVLTFWLPWTATSPIRPTSLRYGSKYGPTCRVNIDPLHPCRIPFGLHRQYGLDGPMSEFKLQWAIAQLLPC